MRFAKRKPHVTISVQKSDTTTASQIPSISRKSGSKSTQPGWKTSVLKHEIIAEIGPLPSAVKNAEPKMLKPHIIKTNPLNKKALQVRSYIC